MYRFRVSSNRHSSFIHLHDLPCPVLTPKTKTPCDIPLGARKQEKKSQPVIPAAHTSPQITISALHSKSWHVSSTPFTPTTTWNPAPASAMSTLRPLLTSVILSVVVNMVLVPELAFAGFPGRAAGVAEFVTATTAVFRAAG